MDNKEYFLFILNNEIYGVEALDVAEIVEYPHITKVPTMNNFVKGVTNIRGNIISVVDLLKRFGLNSTKISGKTSLAIFNKRYLDSVLQIAIIIDEVHAVDYIDTINLEATPNIGTWIDKKFIKSMAKYKNEHIPILDMDQVLDIDEISVLSQEQR